MADRARELESAVVKLEPINKGQRGGLETVEMYSLDSGIDPDTPGIHKTNILGAVNIGLSKSKSNLKIETVS